MEMHTGFPIHCHALRPSHLPIYTSLASRHNSSAEALFRPPFPPLFQTAMKQHGLFLGPCRNGTMVLTSTVCRGQLTVRSELEAA